MFSPITGRDEAIFGIVLAGAIPLDSPPSERSTFLLERGAQDYVGKNSYDDTNQTDK